jgi:hypothetical protein
VSISLLLGHATTITAFAVLAARDGDARHPWRCSADRHGGSELRSKTIWEVAADAGLRSAVVNWWATWPASSSVATPPVVLSDRATLRLEHGGSLDGEIAPPGMYERLRTDWPLIEQEAAESIGRLLPTSSDPDTAAALRRAAEIDVIQLALASRLGRSQPDLLAIYLPGLDIAQQALLGWGNPTGPAALSARLEGLRSYYVFLDAVLHDVATPGHDELVIVIAQPGRIASITHGLLAATGEAADAEVTAAAEVLDIAPTVLHALGLPISRELPGAPVLGLFSSQFARRFPRSRRGDVRTTCRARRLARRKRPGPGDDGAAQEPRIRTLNPMRDAGRLTSVAAGFAAGFDLLAPCELPDPGQGGRAEKDLDHVTEKEGVKTCPQRGIEPDGGGTGEQGEPGDTEQEDDHETGGHGQDGCRVPAIEAALGEISSDECSDRIADQIAAGGAEQAKRSLRQHGRGGKYG